MGFLNLTLPQLLTVFVPLAAALVALYFYDRSRRRLTVSTLRFWPRRPAPPVTRRHRKIQQPWSLALQLLATLLLLLAIADLRFGVFGGEPRRHAIILDQSAAMRYRLDDGSGGVWMDLAKAQALAYLDALPGSDEAALIAAEAAPAVTVAYTADRGALRDAIEALEPGWTALDLEAALDLARSSMLLAAGDDAAAAAGEVVYIGPGRIPENAPAVAASASIPYLRVISIGGEIDDAGVGLLAARRSPADPSRWNVTLEALNDSSAPRQVRVLFEFEGRRLGERTLELPAHGASEIDFRIRTEQAGALRARLEIDDALPENNEALIELPALERLALRIDTVRPNAWRDLLAANPLIEPLFDARRAPALRIADLTVRAESPELEAQIWVRPGAAVSPVPLAREVSNALVTAWSPDHAVTAGVRDADVRLSRASVLRPEVGDVVLAEIAEGPVAVARERDGRRLIVLGFDPLAPELANRLAGPLLFANAVGWFAPESFQTTEIQARAPGTAEVELGAALQNETRVSAESGAAPTWLWRGDGLRLFSDTPGVLRVRTPYQDSRIAMTLPAPARGRWSPPEAARTGIPASSADLAGLELWPWLALLALALLALDWALFGRGTRRISTVGAVSTLSTGISIVGDEEPVREEVLR